MANCLYISICLQTTFLYFVNLTRPSSFSLFRTLNIIICFVYFSVCSSNFLIGWGNRKNLLELICLFPGDHIIIIFVNHTSHVAGFVLLIFLKLIVFYFVLFVVQINL